MYKLQGKKMSIIEGGNTLLVEWTAGGEYIEF